MKRKSYLIFIFCLIIFLCFISCKNNEEKKMSYNNNSVKWINALVYIDIINEQKEYILIEKPESKSRISYHLINLTEDQKSFLEKLNGKMVEAQIKIVEELSPWNKKAYLLSIKE